MKYNVQDIEPYKITQIMDYIETTAITCAIFTRNERSLIDIELQGATQEIIDEVERILTK